MDSFAKMSNILTLGHFMEGLFAAVNKKRKQKGVPPLSPVASVLGRERTKWTTQYQALKNMTVGREIPVTVLPCPHTMQSFWTGWLLELSSEWREAGHTCLKLVAADIGTSHSQIYAPLTEALQLVRTLKFIAKRRKVQQ